MTEPDDREILVPAFVNEETGEVFGPYHRREPEHLPTMEEVLAPYPHLLAEWNDVNDTCMTHQCTPDYEMGQHHGQLATMKVCRERNGGRCQLDA